VNLGARLESLNKEHGTRILMSAATKARLTTAVRSRLVGTVQVKGRHEPVTVHEVLAPEGTGAQA
jgi:adenylate cyclase